MQQHKCSFFKKCFQDELECFFFAAVRAFFLWKRQLPITFSSRLVTIPLRLTDVVLEAGIETQVMQVLLMTVIIEAVQ
jgi:hypothetical protein